MDKLIEGVALTPLNQIFHSKGNVYHGVKKSDVGFMGFGEAYFSTVVNGEVKGWKQHKRMTLNLIVPVGEVAFVIYDGRRGSVTYQSYTAVRLSKENYKRLTVPPGVWMAFKGTGEAENLLLNVASIEHDPEEAETISLDEIAYDWSAL